MPELKINVRESVYYQRVVEMPQEEIDELVEMLRDGPAACDIDDLPVGDLDVTNCEVDIDDIEFNLKVDGKWKYLPI